MQFLIANYWISSTDRSTIVFVETPIMHPPLYLDTARLGKMCISAHSIATAYSDLAFHRSCDPYLDTLLHEGFTAWPEPLREQFVGFCYWKGIGRLKADFREAAEADADTEVLIATRSAELMRVAARLLSQSCKNILVTDLSWPAYQQILEQERVATGSRCSSVSLREEIFHNRLNAAEVTERIVAAYHKQQCDGIFLPLVDNLGVQLPVEAILTRLSQEAELRFSVIDGAQALGHVPISVKNMGCDIFIAGCHKWLAAYHPIGVAFYGRPSTRDYIGETITHWRQSGAWTDPLLEFAQGLEHGEGERPSAAYGETAPLTPLFAASAAICALIDRQQLPELSLYERQQIVDVASDNGWDPLLTDASLWSQILLCKPRYPLPAERPSEKLRQRFFQHSVVLTAYDTGIVRLAFTSASTGDYCLKLLANAFSRIIIEWERGRAPILVA